MLFVNLKEYKKLTIHLKRFSVHLHWIQQIIAHWIESFFNFGFICKKYDKKDNFLILNNGHLLLEWLTGQQWGVYSNTAVKSGI